MKKKTWSKSDINELKKRLEYYRKKMYLHEWMFDLSFSDGYCKDDGPEDRGVLANTEVLHEYKKAKITFFMTTKDEWRRHGDRALDETIKHELAHSITDKLTKLAEERFLSQREIDKECETLTQYISNCIESDYKNVQGHKRPRITKRNKVLAKPKK